MPISKAVVEALKAAIEEHGSAAALRDRIATVDKLIQPFLEEHRKLQERVTELEDLCRRLTAELEAKRRSEDFIEHRGVLFKLAAAGGYHHAVYCPGCRTSMASLNGFVPYSCSCGFIAEFNRQGLDRIMAELPESPRFPNR